MSTLLFSSSNVSFYYGGVPYCFTNGTIKTTGITFSLNAGTTGDQTIAPYTGIIAYFSDAGSHPYYILWNTTVTFCDTNQSIQFNTASNHIKTTVTPTEVSSSVTSFLKSVKFNDFSEYQQAKTIIKGAYGLS